MPSLSWIRSRLRKGQDLRTKEARQERKLNLSRGKRQLYGWKAASDDPKFHAGKPLFYSYRLEITPDNNPYLTLYLSAEDSTLISKNESGPEDITSLIEVFCEWNKLGYKEKRSLAQSFCNELPFVPGAKERSVQLPVRYPDAAWKRMMELLADASAQYLKMVAQP